MKCIHFTFVIRRCILAPIISKNVTIKYVGFENTVPLCTTWQFSLLLRYYLGLFIISLIIIFLDIIFLDLTYLGLRS